MDEAGLNLQVLLELAVRQSHDGSSDEIINNMLPLYMRKLNCFFGAVLIPGKEAVILPRSFSKDIGLINILNPFKNIPIDGEPNLIEPEYDAGFLYVYPLYKIGHFVIGRKSPLDIRIKYELSGVINQLGRTLHHVEEEENLTLFKTLIGLSSDAIQAATEDGRLFYLNESAAGNLGVDARDVKSYRAQDFADFMKNKIVWEDFISLLKEKGNLVLESPITDKKTGNTLIAEFSVRYIKMGYKGFVLGISRDITVRKAAEEAIRKAKLEADFANKAKSEFLANMSHEIRTPLNSILGFSEVLLSSVNDPKQISYLKTILDGGKTLLSLINDILDLSKIEAGKMEISSGSTDFRAIIDEIERMFRREIEKKKLVFSIEVSTDFPQSIFIDEIRLRQILINLVGNAIKFTDFGFVKIKADARNWTSNTVDLEISIIDTGIGISNEFKEKIFDSFSQQSGQDRKKYGGAGLGLAICVRLAKLMNGNIRLDSRDGEGSSFIVSFSKVKYSNTSIEKQSDNITADLIIKFGYAKVLIVDDIPQNRDLIRSYLEDCNLVLFDAESGNEAIEIAAKILPDLIMMDIRMPGISGLEAANILKNNPLTSSIPIIAISASALKSDIENAKTMFAAYLPKPISKRVLIDEMVKILPNNKIESEDQSIKNNLLSDDSHKITKEVCEAFTIELESDIDEQIEFFRIDRMETLLVRLKEFAADRDINILRKKCDDLNSSILGFDVDEIKKNLTEIKSIFIKRG